MRLKTGTLAWKVVTERRRSVLPQLILSRFASKLSTPILAELRKRRITKTYNPGSLLRAAKGAPGLLCFKNKGAAERWANYSKKELGPTKVIKVIGYDEELAVVKGFKSDLWRNFDDFLKGTNMFMAPRNSLSFRRVRVLT